MPQPNELNYTDTFTVINGDGELAVAATVNAAIGSVALNWKTSATGAITSTALTALTAGTDAHTDNRAYMLGPGVLRVDFPDAPWASGASKVWAWLTFSGGLAGYEQAGGMRVFTLGYGLQNPDSGATELAREATVDAVATDVDEILTDTGTTIPATLTTIGTNASTAATGITTILSKLLKYFQLALRKDSTITTTNATEVTEIGGTFSNQSDSQEAIRDRGDAVWTGSGGGGGAGIAVPFTGLSSTSGVSGNNEFALASDPDAPEIYVGTLVTIGSQTLTITTYDDGTGVYTVSANLSPYPSANTAVTLHGHVESGLISYNAATGGTPTAEDISPARTWKFPRSNVPITASNTVTVAASQAGTVTVCFDVAGVLETNVIISSISTPTITGTAATLGTAVIHTSYRKVNIPLTNITATPGTYTVSLTFVATDSEQYVVRGTLEVV